MEKSVLGKYWSQKKINENLVLELSKNLDISDFLSRLLASRISSVDGGYHYLNPKIANLLPDPFHLIDMDKAVDRTIHAIEKKEKICIFADYDVDGATSSALLKNIFREIGIIADIYVPDRIIEGYGPNLEAMQKIRDKGTKLLITVDCGSVAFEALEHASSIGLDTIVIDHHLSLESMPKAVAVVNPNRFDEHSEYKHLAAVGVSFLFAAGLIAVLKKRQFFEKKMIEMPNLLKQLDLVALGTVCDVMSLTGLNRAFVKQGLIVAKQRSNIGYNALCDISKLEESINCYHLGFLLGPRINAGGRVGKAHLGSALLSTSCAMESQSIAKQLDIYNNERKVIEMQMLEEADNIAILQSDDAMLFITGEGWHPGVIGIVAGRLKDKYNKPVAVIALNEGEGKASCRSVAGIDFGNLVIESKLAGLVIAGGGHAMAAGFTVKQNKLEELQLFLNKHIAIKFDSSDKHLKNEYDMDLTTKAANISVIEMLSRLEPYGNGNPTPIFRFSKLYVLKAGIVGSKHIKVIFSPDKKQSLHQNSLHAIAFNSVGTKLHDVLLSQRPHTLDVLGTLKLNEWNGNSSLQLQIRDVYVQ